MPAPSGPPRAPATAPPAASLNNYQAFRSLKPDEVIDDAVLVYRGDFDLHQAASMARAQAALHLVWAGKGAEALDLAQEAVALDPTVLLAQTALGDALAASGKKQEAREHWQAALKLGMQLDPSARMMFVPDLEAKLK